MGRAEPENPNPTRPETGFGSAGSGLSALGPGSVRRSGTENLFFWLFPFFEGRNYLGLLFGYGPTFPAPIFPTKTKFPSRLFRFFGIPGPEKFRVGFRSAGKKIFPVRFGLGAYNKFSG